MNNLLELAIAAMKTAADYSRDLEKLRLEAWKADSKNPKRGKWVPEEDNAAMCAMMRDLLTEAVDTVEMVKTKRKKVAE